ncbi:MAG: Hsp20/alpha crystallin family protein [Bacillaceae bacterium]
MMTEKEEKETQPEGPQFKGYLQKMNQYLENSPIRGMFDEMNSFFDRNFFTVIPIDIYETEKDLVIRADIPGVQKNQITIDIMGDVLKLTVTNDITQQQLDEQINFHKKERSYMHASRTVKLPYPVDRDTARANYQNGILEIKAPLNKVKLPPIEID